MWSKGTPAPATTIVAHSYPINIFVCGPLQPIPSPITSTDIIQNTHTVRATGEYYQLKVRKDEKKMSKRLERCEEMGRGRFNRPNKRSLNRLRSTSSRPQVFLIFFAKVFSGVPHLFCSGLSHLFLSFSQLFPCLIKCATKINLSPIKNKMYAKL